MMCNYVVLHSIQTLDFFDTRTCSCLSQLNMLPSQTVGYATLRYVTLRYVTVGYGLLRDLYSLVGQVLLDMHSMGGHICVSCLYLPL